MAKYNIMKGIMVFIPMLIIGEITHAQFIKIGVKAGANLVKIDGQSFSGEYNLGYHAGFFSEIKLTKTWGLQPEVVFSETQLKTSTDFKDIYNNILDISTISKIKLQQINIPILINFKPSNILIISAGPQFSAMMDRGEGLLSNGKKAFAMGDASLVAGVALAVWKCRLQTRYMLGMRDLNGIDNKDSWKNQAAQISLGFIL